MSNYIFTAIFVAEMTLKVSYGDKQLRAFFHCQTLFMFAQHPLKICSYFRCASSSLYLYKSSHCLGFSPALLGIEEMFIIGMRSSWILVFTKDSWHSNMDFVMMSNVHSLSPGARMEDITTI